MCVWYTGIGCSVDYNFFVLMNQNERILTLRLNDGLKIKCGAGQYLSWLHAVVYLCFRIIGVFPTGIIKVLSYLTLLVHRCSKELKEKKNKKRAPAHHVPRCCDGGHGTLSIAWVMSQVPQKSFTTICVSRSCGECGMPFSGSSWTFSGSSWPGQMVWLKLPPLPLQQEIKHRS